MQYDISKPILVVAHEKSGPEGGSIRLASKNVS